MAAAVHDCQNDYSLVQDSKVDSVWKATKDRSARIAMDARVDQRRLDDIFNGVLDSRREC
jgi:hypothetical protein